MKLIDADRLKQDLDMCIETSKILQDSNSANLDTAHHICELESFKRIINLQTTIDAEPIRYGKWVNDKGLYKCSLCNELWLHWWAIVVPPERMYKEMKYCPYCGAKMNEE